jgi:hypothetical protein
VCLNSIDESDWEFELGENSILEQIEEIEELKVENSHSDLSAISVSKSPIRVQNKMVKTPTTA